MRTGDSLSTDVMFAAWSSIRMNSTFGRGPAGALVCASSTVATSAIVVATIKPRRKLEPAIAARQSRWKFGDASDFLGLTPEEDALIDLRLKLAEGLKDRRLRKRLTQIDLAKAVRSSQSRVAKMEAGDSTVSIDLLVRSLIALGASSRDLANIIAPR